MSAGVPEIIAAIEESRFDEEALGDLSGFVQGPPFNEPTASPGSSSATFRHDSEDGSSRAIRIFHTVVPGDETLDRMEIISRRVDSLNEDAGFRIAPLKVHRDAVHLGSSSLPAIVMPWIDGSRIDRCARESAIRGDKGTLSGLAKRVERLGLGMSKNGFDHGDISGANIIVDYDGELWLIDPDTLRHSTVEDDDFHLREVGHEHYAHPNRSSLRWEEDLFRFPLEVLIVSLEGLAIMPDLVHRFGNDDNSLLFKREDLDDPDDSELFEILCEKIGKRANRLKVACKRQSVSAANKMIGKMQGPQKTPERGIVLPKSPLISVVPELRVRQSRGGVLPLSIPGIMSGGN